jgi:hypothetical protein
MTALAQHLDEYLQLRRTLGHKLADAHRLLPRFVAYLGEQRAEFVTIEAALAWSPSATPPPTRSSARARAGRRCAAPKRDSTCFRRHVPQEHTGQRKPWITLVR